MTVVLPQLTDEQFLELCQLNRELRVERNAQGDLVIMPPTGGETSNRNAALITLLTSWAWQDGTGETFDSSAGFNLPNGALRSPDAAWVKRSSLAALTPDQRAKFLPLCPDFVVELLSPSDSLSVVQEKMQEYLANGAQLGWLLDPAQKQVHVYRPQQPVEILANPAEIAGDPVLPGFILNLHRIWQTNL